MGYEENDGKGKHAYLDGQFIYTSLIDLNDEQFIAEIKLYDNSINKEFTTFKDIVIEKASLYAKASQAQILKNNLLKNKNIKQFITINAEDIEVRDFSVTLTQKNGEKEYFENKKVFYQDKMYQVKNNKVWIGNEVFDVEISLEDKTENAVESNQKQPEENKQETETETETEAEDIDLKTEVISRKKDKEELVKEVHSIFNKINQNEVIKHSAEETNKVINNFMANNFPQYIYESVTTDTIDEQIKRQAEIQGADISNIEAWIEPESNKIYINSEVIAPHDVPRVIFHELVGHYGLPTIIGKKDFHNFLLKIWKENRNEIEKKKDIYSNISNLKLTEEWLADNAEKFIKNSKEMGFFQKAITSFKNLLRTLPFTKDVRYTNNDIANLMQKAFKYTKNQPGNEVKVPGENTKFSLLDYEKKVVDSANQSFNNQLENYISQNKPDHKIFMLGNPSSILKSTGIPNLPIELSSSRLSIKSDKSYINSHPFNTSELKDLVRLINDPVAVFKYKNGLYNENILLEIQKDNKNFIVGLQFGNDTIEINDIRTVFPKDTYEWLFWIQNNKLLYVDKKRAVDIIDQQRINLAEVANLNLDSIENIIKEFKNPNQDSENNTKFSLTAPNNNIKFSIKKSEQNNWEKIVTDFENGTLDKRKIHIALQRTPDILQACKVDNLPMTITYGTLEKITKTKHQIPLSELNKLLSEIDNPIAILQSRTVPDSIVLFTDIIDNEKNNKSLVAIHLNKTKENLEVNEISSIHGRNVNNFHDMLKDEKALYVNQKKSRDYLRSRGLQLPTEANKNGNKLLLTEEDFTSNNIGKIVEDLGNTSQNSENNTNFSLTAPNNNIKFSIKKSEHNLWNNILNSYQNGTLDKTRSHTILNETPIVLQKCGADNLPISIDYNTIEKINKKKHQIDIHDLRNIQIELDNPIAILKSRKEPDTLLVLTSMIDKSENKTKKSVIILTLNKSKFRMEVNDISSVYGRTEQNIHEMLKDELGLYVNQKKSRDYLQSIGLQLPKVASKNGNKLLLTEEDFTSNNIGKIVEDLGNTSQNSENNTKFSIKTNLNLQNQAHITKIKEFGRKVNLKDTADIRNYLKEHFTGQKIEIKSDGRLAVISNAGIKSAVKKRGIHRETFSSLDEIIENSYFVGYEENDGKGKHAYLDGQFIYTSLIDLNDEQFIAEIKLDDNSINKEFTTFKDIVIEKASLYAGPPNKSDVSLPEAGFHKLNIGEIIQNIKTKFKDNPRFQENSENNTKFSLTAPEEKHLNILEKITPKLHVKTSNQTKEILLQIKGKELHNNHDNTNAKINGKGINKILSSTAMEKSRNNGFTNEEHLTIAANLEQLFPDAFLSKIENDRIEDANLNAIKRYSSLVFINDKFVEALWTVKDTTQHGNNIYSVELMDLELKEKPPETTQIRASTQQSQMTARSLTDGTDNINNLYEQAIDALKNKYKFSLAPEEKHLNILEKITPKLHVKTRGETESILKKIKGKELHNNNDNINAKITGKGIGKITSNAAMEKSNNNGFTNEEHLTIAANLEQLFPDAFLSKIENDRIEDANLNAIKRYSSLVFINDKFVEALWTVKDTTQHGNNIYSVELMDLELKEKPPETAHTKGAAKKLENQLNPLTDGTDNINNLYEQAIDALKNKYKFSLAPEEKYLNILEKITPKLHVNTQQDAIGILNKIKNKELHNNSDNSNAKITGKGIGKILSKKAMDKSNLNGFTNEEHLTIAANLEQLFPDAFLSKVESDRIEDANINAIKRYSSLVFINDKFVEALWTVKDTTQHGNNIYSVELMDLELKEKPPETAHTEGATRKLENQLNPLTDGADNINNLYEQAIDALKNKYKFSLAPESKYALLVEALYKLNQAQEIDLQNATVEEIQNHLAGKYALPREIYSAELVEKAMQKAKNYRLSQKEEIFGEILYASKSAEKSAQEYQRILNKIDKEKNAKEKYEEKTSLNLQDQAHITKIK